jgi:hypothetical protein
MVLPAAIFGRSDAAVMPGSVPPQHERAVVAEDDRCASREQPGRMRRDRRVETCW